MILKPTLLSIVKELCPRVANVPYLAAVRVVYILLALHSIFLRSESVCLKQQCESQQTYHTSTRLFGSASRQLHFTDTYPRDGSTVLVGFAARRITYFSNCNESVQKRLTKQKILIETRAELNDAKKGKMGFSFVKIRLPETQMGQLLARKKI